MIGVCSRRIATVCRVTWETSEEDAADPGPDRQGPACPECYRHLFNNPPNREARRATLAERPLP